MKFKHYDESQHEEVIMKEKIRRTKPHKSEAEQVKGRKLNKRRKVAKTE
ncbi:hypothetical protein [Bacillus cereus group sp. BfR-BA-02730]|nr:hypothetical protein [Bacillus cereus group sp. BfR-BA-02730]MDX5808282.1 hypothetical protein [Bacillus cereus group sp. BfR-BA-02730]